MRHAHHLHRIHCGLPLPSPPLCNQSTLALTHTSVESTPQPPTLLTSRPCPSHPQTTPNNNTPPTQLLLSAAQPPSPTTPVPPSAPLSPCAAPPSPRRHTHNLPCGGACDRQPPITTAATTGTCAHEDPKCRPHRASSASRMMMPHSSATQPQPQSSADRTSARKPQRLPPRKPPSHTHPHACTHTHTRHET